VTDGYFQPGQTIIIREFWKDRFRRILPVIVVQDKPELMAFYAPLHTILKLPTDMDRLRSEWILKDSESAISSLRLVIPFSNYSLLLFWNPDGSLRLWYINLESPLRRTPLGFDYIDELLDITAPPDLTRWQWEDENELADAVNLGQLSRSRAELLRDEGEKAIAWLQSGKSPFNEWANWRPDPSWKVPVLPEGWDVF
jgi:hypothetical protein